MIRMRVFVMHAGQPHLNRWEAKPIDAVVLGRVHNPLELPMPSPAARRRRAPAKAPANSSADRPA